MQRELIKVDGTREPSPAPRSMAQIQKAIGSTTCDAVNLRNGFVMIVDDLGHVFGKPMNNEATKLYWAVCRPGTTHTIVGDVFVCPDADFGED